MSRLLPLPYTHLSFFRLFSPSPGLGCQSYSMPSPQACGGVGETQGKPQLLKALQSWSVLQVCAGSQCLSLSHLALVVCRVGVAKLLWSSFRHYKSKGMPLPRREERQNLKKEKQTDTEMSGKEETNILPPSKAKWALHSLKGLRGEKVRDLNYFSWWVWQQQNTQLYY